MAPFDESGFKSSLAKMQGSAPSTTSGSGGFDHAGFQATLARLKSRAAPTPSPTQAAQGKNPFQQIGDAVGGWMHQQAQESAQARKRAAAIQDPFAPEKALLRPAAAPAGAVLHQLQKTGNATEALLSDRPWMAGPALTRGLTDKESQDDFNHVLGGVPAVGVNALPAGWPQTIGRTIVHGALDPLSYVGGLGFGEKAYKAAAEHVLPAVLKGADKAGQAYVKVGRKLGGDVGAGNAQHTVDTLGHIVSGAYKASVPGGALKLGAARDFREKGDTIANRMFSAKNAGRAQMNAMQGAFSRELHDTLKDVTPEEESQLYDALHFGKESDLPAHLQPKAKRLSDLTDSLAYLSADRELKGHLVSNGFQLPEYAKPFDRGTRSLMRKTQYRKNYVPTRNDAQLSEFDASPEELSFLNGGLDNEGKGVTEALTLRAEKKAKPASVDQTETYDPHLERRQEEGVLAATPEEQRAIFEQRLHTGARAIAGRDTGRRATALFNGAKPINRFDFGPPTEAKPADLFRYQSTAGGAEVSPRRGGTFFAMGKPTEKYANMGKLGGQNLIQRINTAKNPLDIRYKGSGRVPDFSKLSPEDLSHARRHSFGDYSHLPGAGVAAHVFPQAEQIAGDGTKFLGGVPEAQELARAFAEKDMPTLHKWLEKLGVPQEEIDSEYGHGNFYAAEDRIGVELARKAGHDALIMHPNPHANSILNPDSDEFVALNPSSHSEPRQAGGRIRDMPAKAGSFSGLPDYVRDFFTDKFTPEAEKSWQSKAAEIGLKGVNNANKSAMFISPVRHIMNIATLGTLADPSVGGALQTAKTFAKIVGASPEKRYAELKDAIDAGAVGVPSADRVTGETAKGGLSKVLSDMTMKTPIISHAINGVRKLYTMSGDILWSFDDAAKATNFRRNVAKGMHPADAAAKTGAELIDYTNKSDFTNLVSYLAPFATYRTKLPGAIARNVIQHPERALTVNRAAPALAGGFQQAGNGPDGKPQGLHSNLPLAEVMRGADDPEGYLRSTLGALPRAVGSMASVFDSDQYPHYLTYGQEINNAGDVAKSALVNALGNIPGIEQAESAYGISQFPNKGIQGLVGGQLGLSLGRIPVSEDAIRKDMESEKQKGHRPTRAQVIKYLQYHGGGS